jgi:hypothetical protein
MINKPQGRDYCDSFKIHYILCFLEENMLTEKKHAHLMSRKIASLKAKLSGSYRNILNVIFIKVAQNHRLKGQLIMSLIDLVNL